MRRDRSGFIWQIILAVLLAAAGTQFLRWAGTVAMTIALFLSLSVFFVYALGLARVLLRARRPRTRPCGGGWNRGRGEWSGVREPRRPRPPFWPPRAAAAVPEDTERQQTSSSAGSSDSPRQPLRLEDRIT
jgi:hypothetical protein